MGWIKETFTSSIGRKLIMSLTGLFLIGFLLVHLLGNISLITDPSGETFNAYAHFMAHNTLIRIGEFVLAAGFLFHIIEGIILVIKNKKARPVGYAKSAGTVNASWASKNMGLLGLLIFVFLIVHLSNFFAKAKILDVSPGVIDWMVDANDKPVLDADGNKIRDLYTVVAASLSTVWYSTFYIICMIALAFHLNHGFQSAFQSLGINHKKYTPILKGLGTAYSILVPAGFILTCVWFLYTGCVCNQ